MFLLFINKIISVERGGVEVYIYKDQCSASVFTPSAFVQAGLVRERGSEVSNTSIE